MTTDKINKNFLQVYCLYKLNSIDGNLKFEKVCFNLKESLITSGHECGSNFDFKRDSFGPRDPGISKANLKFEMMDILEIENELENKSKTYIIKDKGKLWIESLINYFRKIEPEFDIVKMTIDESLENDKDLKGYQLVEKENIQKTKKELFGKKL
ncbi:hypothetical protein MettiDRAFT_2640 [Methanolobus tindarius DSM 2278]|uniref:Antitoxin SocA-like Panacea domain-containing protein n=1 Tax=Methanolobus tindarius DSM 2278 TaxID=1090322 RepID=W9E0K6_METTI|nr:hypothetical protein [Methanolobus tindarius]ETA69146.1 hypothetical protein MettiDRAFT_2640 [Methanolobus tindarius DSM 2278]